MSCFCTSTGSSSECRRLNWPMPAEYAQIAEVSYQQMSLKMRYYVREIAATHSPYVIDRSREAAQRLLDESSLLDDERIEVAFRRFLGRRPHHGRVSLSPRYSRAVGMSCVSRRSPPRR